MKLRKYVSLLLILVLFNSCDKNDILPNDLFNKHYGRALIYTKNVYGTISIYINDDFMGAINTVSSYEPECGSPGNATLVLPEGTYEITAYAENDKSWNGEIIVVKGTCSVYMVNH